MIGSSQSKSYAKTLTVFRSQIWVSSTMATTHALETNLWKLTIIFTAENSGDFNRVYCVFWVTLETLYWGEIRPVKPWQILPV